MMKYLLVLVFLYFVCVNARDGEAKKEKEGRKASGKKIAMTEGGDISITIRSVSTPFLTTKTELGCSAGGSGARRNRAGPCAAPWLGNTVNTPAKDCPVSIKYCLV